MMNLVNGGVHANNRLDMQEFMIIPLGLPNLREAVRCGAEVFSTLRTLLNKEICPRQWVMKAGLLPALLATKRHWL